MTPPGPWLSANQIRITVRVSFIALLLAAILLPYASIRSQKSRSAAEQAKNIEVNQQRIVDRLLSPAGQLALLNPDRINKPPTPLRPVILPFAEMQADLPNIVLDQVRTVGCPIQFREAANSQTDQGSVCVGLRKSDSQDVRGRLFIAGTFVSTSLIPHVFLDAAGIEAGRPVAKRFQDAHRIKLDLSDGTKTYRWTLPVQVRVDPTTRKVKEGLGLTAYKLDDQGIPLTQKPDFTGAWLVEGECTQPDVPAGTCQRTHTFSIAVPRDKWGTQTQDGSLTSHRSLSLRLTVNAPAVGGKPQVLLDTEVAQTAVLPFVNSDLQNHLLPGESLTVMQLMSGGEAQEIFTLKRPITAEPSRLLNLGERVLNLIQIDLQSAGESLEKKRPFAVRGNNFELIHKSSPQGPDQELVQSSALMAAYAVLMIASILVVWITIEVGIVRRVLRLTRRTRQVSRVVRTEGDLDQFDFSDLRGRDELGVLASGLDDLLRRIGEDLQREAIRVQHQSSMLRAIGHEIRSPLQSLSAILAESEQGRTYVRRMLRAVDALYGSASPSDGIQGADLDAEEMNLGAFLASVAKNAHHAGIENVVFDGPTEGILVRADPSALEDTLSHILTNAKRYRPAGTAITISLIAQEVTASITIHNHGPHIPANLLSRIFEYGVSDRPDSAEGNHGQGLFVAATYLSKMGARITAQNLSDGVAFVVDIPTIKG
jgi:signal transduction histidine kinase